MSSPGKLSVENGKDSRTVWTQHMARGSHAKHIWGTHFEVKNFAALSGVSPCTFFKCKPGAKLVCVGSNTTKLCTGRKRHMSTHSPRADTRFWAASKLPVVLKQKMVCVGTDAVQFFHHFKAKKCAEFLPRNFYAEFTVENAGAVQFTAPKRQ